MRIAHCHEKLENDQLALQYFKKGIVTITPMKKHGRASSTFISQKEKLKDFNYYCEKSPEYQRKLPCLLESALLNKTLERYAEAEIAFQTPLK